MEELLQELDDYQTEKVEINYDFFDKIEGDIMPGAQVEIFWEGREESDFGYIFTLPEQGADDYDVFVHIPKPDNSDGIDDAPEVYIHMYNLVSNERVEKVLCIPNKFLQ